MLDPLRQRWRRGRETRRLRRAAADLPDHILRDIGLERDRTGRLVLRHFLHLGH